MSERRLIYFTANESRVYSWRAGRLEHEGTYAGDEAGIEEFHSFVKLHAK